MKRTFSFVSPRALGTVLAGSGLIAATYGLVRLAYGLFLPDVQAELHFNAAAAGVISSGGSIVYCLGATVGFFTASRHPRLLVVGAGMSASLGAAGMAASRETASFAAFAIIGSLGAGLASPGLVSIVRRNVDPRADDRSQAAVNAGTGPGLVVAGILALVLLPDWRLAWIVGSAVAVVAAASVLVLDRGGRGSSSSSGGNARQRVPPVLWFVAHRFVVVAAVLMGAGSAAVWNYGRALLVDAGASEQVSVGAWIGIGIGGTAVIGTARVLSAIGPRAVWTVTTLTMAAALVTLAFAPRVTLAALLACAVFGWGYTAGSGGLIAWTTKIDAARAPAGTSLLFVVLALGQTLGSSAVGALVSSAGFTAAFLAAAVVTLAATALPLWPRRRRRWAGGPLSFGMD